MLLAQLGLGETVQLSRVFSVDVLCGVACVVCYVSDIRYKVLCSEKSWRVNQNRNSETSRLNSIKKVT